MLGSVVLFGLTVRGAGLAPSLVLLVLVSAVWASDKFNIKSALLAIASAVFSGLVFVKGLGLPFAVIGPLVRYVGGRHMEILANLSLGFSTAFSLGNLFLFRRRRSRHPDRRSSRPRPGR